jgi:hypothetical protein
VPFASLSACRSSRTSPIARALSLYTNDAPVPASVLDGPSRWSLHALNGSDEFIISLFVLHAAAALAFSVGFRVRIMAFVLLVLTISVQARAALSLYSGDTLLRALLVWSLFLPLDRRFAVGAARGPGGCSSLACFALVVQVVLFFLCAGVAKLWSPAWRDGSAIEIILQTNLYATPFGQATAEVFGLAVLRIATYASLMGELLMPIALLIVRARVAAMMSLVAIMVGISLFMSVGLFPMLAVTALVPFAPPSLWRDSRGETVSDATQEGIASAAVPRTSWRILARRIVLGSLIALMVSTSALNAMHLDTRPWTPGIIAVTGLAQRWMMFSTPEIMERHTWPYVVGPGDDGVLLDVISGEPARPDEVPAPLGLFLSFRERRVVEELWTPRAQPMWPFIARWMCSLAPVGSLTVYLAHGNGTDGVRYARVAEASCVTRARD